MIARHEGRMDRENIWERLAAPLPAGVVSWRQDGKPSARGEKWFARFVAYIEANTVRERLDAVVPGEWDLTLDLMPQIPGVDDESAAASFKARLQILGVIREDVGTGKDYKQAATDAFKRAAVRFGIAHELYAYEQNWVQVDGDGKYARPLEDPQTAYTRRWGAAKPVERTAVAAVNTPTKADPVAEAEEWARKVEKAGEQPKAPGVEPVTPAASAGDDPICPKCSGRLWDNRVSKRNPKAPDWKCRDRSCDGVIWPAKGEKATPVAASREDEGDDFGYAPFDESDNEVPF